MKKELKKPTIEMVKFYNEVRKKENDYWREINELRADVKKRKIELEKNNIFLIDALIGFGAATKILVEKQNNILEKINEVEEEIKYYKKENIQPMPVYESFKMEFNENFFDYNFN